MNDGLNFKEHITAFEQLLNGVNVEKVSPEIYCRKYLGHLLEHKKYYLSIYAAVFEKLVDSTDKKKNELSLIDFGAGNGLLGIFAKACGFKKVFINDIDEKFVNASKNLAQQLNVHIDGYITGDIHDVQHYFKESLPDAIAGTDVIEHIYNLEDFFATMHKINPAIISVFTTASNPKNYFKVRQLKKLQLKDEYEGGSPGDFILFGDKAHEPFYETRRNIILLHLNKTDSKTVDELAKATRGMNEHDILQAVKLFQENGKMPAIITHATNTCNPLNGSWTERILPLEDYSNLYNSHGMNLKIYNGFYDIHKAGIKGFLNKILNLAIHSLGIRFAPFIIFSGSKI